MRDNEIVILPRAHSQEERFASAVAAVERRLAPKVVRIRYDFKDDWIGEPAVFFKVILSDAITEREHRREVINMVETEIDREIEPEEQWGVLPYFRFRSQSEQAHRFDPAWA
jgi:hypothetical protein